MSTKHTAEPWHVSFSTSIARNDGFKRNVNIAECYQCFGDDDKPTKTIEEAEANATRIVQCVNACQGIPDPAAALQHAREALRFALDVILDGGDPDERSIVEEALRALGGTP